MNEKQQKYLRERYRIYKINPLEWFKDFFGDALRREYTALTGLEPVTETGLTRDQERAFIELGKIVEAKLKRHREEKLTDDEEYYASRIGISVMSGQGLGKDFFGALAMWWFMANFGDELGDTKCMATATSSRQLKNVFWSEMGKTAAMSLRHKGDDGHGGTLLEEMFVKQTDLIYARFVGKKKNEGNKHFLEAATINTKNSVEEQGEALAGRHAKFMLILADEASGIAEGVFKPLEGTLTGVINLIITIFNPTRTRGYAIESQKEDSPYVALHWDGENSDLEPVLRTRNETLLKKYGRDSNPYRIRVRGLPPLVEADTLIPMDLIEDAVRRHEASELKPADNDPWMIGVDPAAGGDNAIILKRRGPVVDAEIQRYRTQNTSVLESAIIDTLEEHMGRYGCFIDNIGLGYHLVCNIKTLGYRKVYGVDVRKRPTEEENPKFEGYRFRRLRDQLWWKVRMVFEDGGIAIPADQNLIDQLSVLKWREENGVVVVSSKKEIKRDRTSGAAGGADWESTDEADALMHTYAKEDRMFRSGAGKRQGTGRKIDMSGVFMR